MSLPNPRIEQELIRYVNEEQRRRILDYKWIESEKEGYDLGETAIFDWIDKNAETFRKWADSIPYRCFECGLCVVGIYGKECPFPYDPERLKIWERFLKKVKNLDTDQENEASTIHD